MPLQLCSALLAFLFYIDLSRACKKAYAKDSERIHHYQRGVTTQSDMISTDWIVSMCRDTHKLVTPSCQSIHRFLGAMKPHIIF